MKKNQNSRIITILLLGLTGVMGVSQTAEVFTIGFYNLENLFDPNDNPNTLDEDYTPAGRKIMDRKAFKAKDRPFGKGDLPNRLPRNPKTPIDFGGGRSGKFKGFENAGTA